VAPFFAGEILQILSNLILNSLDALPESAAVLCVRVTTSEDKLHITIADNGIPMKRIAADETVSIPHQLSDPSLLNCDKCYRISVAPSLLAYKVEET
jgi:hypothetical protein